MQTRGSHSTLRRYQKNELSLIFVPRGHISGGMPLTLASPDGQFSRHIVINLAGRVRID